MALTETIQTNTTDCTHSFTFPYLNKSDIKVSIKNNAGTVSELIKDNANGYSVQTTQITLLGTARTAVEGAAHDVRIYRITDDADLTATFYPGSAIRSADLNDNFTQNLFTTQEVVSRYLDKQGTIAWEGDMDAGGYQLTNAGKITSTELDINGPVDVTGTTKLSGTVDIDGNVDIDTADVDIDATTKVDITAPTVDIDGTTTVDINSPNINLVGTTNLDTVDIDGAVDMATTLHIHGNIDADGAIDVAGISQFNDDVNFIGTAANTSWDKSASALEFQDTAKASFGADSDLKIYHDGTNSFIYNDGSNITITADASSGTAQSSLVLTDSGTFALYAGANDAYLQGSSNLLACYKPLVPNGTVDLGTVGLKWNTAYINNLAGDCIVTTGTTNSDTTVFSSKYTDDNFLRQTSSETLASGWSDLGGPGWPTDSTKDSKVATLGAIDERIIDLVDKVGGFVAISNEYNFPTANPDLENNTGTIVSITALSADVQASNSGVLTSTEGFWVTGSPSNQAVTITGCGADQVFKEGYGLLVQTTAVEHTYSFVRYVPNTSQVATVAANTDSIGKVATIDSDVTKVAVIDTDVTKVANIDDKVTTVATEPYKGKVETVADDLDLGASSKITIVAESTYKGKVEAVADDATDIGTVAGKATEIGNLGTTTAVTNLGTVAGISGNVTTVANNDSNVTKVATIDANVTKVANIDANVTKVANIDTDVTDVAGIKTDITTVAGDINGEENVSTVGRDVGSKIGVKDYQDWETPINYGDDLTTHSSTADYSNVTSTVTTELNYNDHSRIELVFDNITDINTVAGKATEIGLLGDSDVISDMEDIVDTTNLITGTKNLDKVAAIKDDVTKVADIDANVTKVAVIDGNVTKVADIDANVTKVAVIDGNVTKVADIDGNVTTVAGISANTTTVAGIAADVTTVAGISANTTTVAGISANVTTVAGNNANVTTCATNISNINGASANATAAQAAQTAAELAETNAEAARDLALSYKNSALIYSNSASNTYSSTQGLYTQQASIAYNLGHDVTSHTDWGSVNDVDSVDFVGELAATTLLTMSKGSGTYSYNGSSGNWFD